MLCNGSVLLLLLLLLLLCSRGYLCSIQQRAQNDSGGFAAAVVTTSRQGVSMHGTDGQIDRHHGFVKVFSASTKPIHTSHWDAPALPDEAVDLRTCLLNMAKVWRRVLLTAVKIALSVRAQHAMV
jgi:hypothetical protein